MGGGTEEGFGAALYAGSEDVVSLEANLQAEERAGERRVVATEAPPCTVVSTAGSRFSSPHFEYGPHRLGNRRRPFSRFFASNHARDNANGCPHDEQRAILAQIGLERLGVADVDSSAPPFQDARVIDTDADRGKSTKFHGSVLKKGLGANAAVWRYVLTEPVE